MLSKELFTGGDPLVQEEDNDLTARVQEMAGSDWRDIVGEYQAECNPERFRKPPRRNWKLDL